MKTIGPKLILSDYSGLASDKVHGYSEKIKFVKLL